jgi:protein tyrosine phosphatase (PTP) superfamily phosphohydrolase (DUF442 family)
MSLTNLEYIYNFLKISEEIATAGQPTAEQFTAIKNSGYQLIVNLVPPTMSNTLSDEQKIVESQGMEYINIPVIWGNPTIENVTEFFKIIQANTDKKIFVHCAANKRVSAFVYLYRRLYQGIDDAIAKPALYQVWVPNEIWTKFIQDVINQYQQGQLNF